MRKAKKAVRKAAEAREGAEESGLVIGEAESKFHAKRGEIRESDPNTEQRLFRAIQWTKRGLSANSMVEQIILLWIAFNALYGREEHLSEKIARRSVGASTAPPFIKFLEDVVDCGRGDVAIAVRECQDACGEILQCRYVYQNFWNAMADNVEWRKGPKGFDRLNERALKAVRSGNLSSALPEVFRRVNVLRNQLFHGGAAFFCDDAYSDRAKIRETERQREDENHPFNGTQVRAGRKILRALVPVFVRVVLNNHDKRDWGNLSYPPQALPDQKAAQPTRLR